MSTRGRITMKGVIRFHAKSRTGCLTCRKRRVKCDETAPVCNNCHRRELVCVPRPKTEHRQQGSALYKPLTSPTPSSFVVDAATLELFHHCMTLTSASYITNSTFLAQTGHFLPQVMFSNPACMHATLSFAALHLGRLYESNSSPSSQNWIARASAHRNAAVGHILSPALDPGVHFLTLVSLSTYVISLSLSSPSSLPENIFSLVTLVHNICFPLKQFLYTDPWLQGWDSEQPDPSAATFDSRTGFLAPLHHLYDNSANSSLDREELDNPDVKEAYRTAVLGLGVMYTLVQMGLEARGAFFWPALVGKRFVRLLNKRKQRALVILYYYLMTLRNLNGRWWVSEAGRWVNYVYGLINERWREWLREVTAEKARIVIRRNPVY